jgi:hypothetical protein
MIILKHGMYPAAVSTGKKPEDQDRNSKRWSSIILAMFRNLEETGIVCG